MLLTCRCAFETSLAPLVYKSLKPEIENQVTDRSSVEMKAEMDSFFLTVSSDDLVAMRSTLNTWLRLIQVAVETAACLE